jgi:hypothetical protein
MGAFPAASSHRHRHPLKKPDPHPLTTTRMESTCHEHPLCNIPER